MFSVTVIIVNYNGGLYIKRCIDCLTRQTFSSFKVTIVDNGSSDNSLELFKDLDNRFSVISSEKNIGFAAANNLAIKQADTAWIATLNPDAFPREDWLEKLMEGSSKYPDAAMFGSVQIQDRNPSLLDGIGDVYSGIGICWRGAYDHSISEIHSDCEIFSPCAAASLYKLSAFRQANGFDEKFFCYCEDVDLGFRLRLLGYKCVILKDALVSHLGSESVGRYGDFAIYHGFRNRIWTFLKNYPNPLFYLIAPLNLLLTIALAIDKFRIGKGIPAMRGVMDALRDMRRVWGQRKHIQANTSVKSGLVYKSMCWSATKVIRRASDLRPVR